VTKNIQKFRDGIFALFTRRFGVVAELMIERLFKFEKSKNQFYDRYDNINKKRVEIKFSRALKANEKTITIANIIEQIFNANVEKRMFSSDEVKIYNFDCNIQQVKVTEFDILYYGIFFSDKIAIFKINSERIVDCPDGSAYQHKGNEGEGQFHLKSENYDYHIKNHFDRWITYEELHALFGGKI